jgi:hypothetical protein
MAGSAVAVSVAANNIVWSVNPLGNAQSWNGAGWDAHGNPGAALTSISAGTGSVVATAPAGPFSQLFVLQANGTWSATNLDLDQVAGSDANHLAGVVKLNATTSALWFGSIAPMQAAEELAFSPHASATGKPATG